MRTVFALAALIAGCFFSDIAAAEDGCARVNGDVVIGARTPEVDLFDAPEGQRVRTIADSSFPQCQPITGRAPNMMLRITIDGSSYWVPPHMVSYRFAGALPPICRNLGMGGDDVKVGATRGLGEGCPKPTQNGGAP